MRSGVIRARRCFAMVLLMSVAVGAQSMVGTSAAPAGEVGTSPSSSGGNVVSGAVVGRSVVPLAADTITFDDYPLNTLISRQYQSRGVAFGGDSPFITTDRANPTSPVLSGTPKFQGAIEMRIVKPGSGAATTTSGISLDVGYINNLNSVQVSYFDKDGKQLGSVRANAYGINTLNIPVTGIARVRVAAVESEPYGFAIDNVRIGTASAGNSPRRMIELGDSYSSGEGLLPEKNLSYDCGTDMPLGTYYENTNVGVPGRRGARVNGGKPCDTISKSAPPKDFRKRPSKTYENKCHRHARAWPNRVREDLGISSSNALFVACSGAVTANLGYLPSPEDEPQYARSPNGVAGGETQAANAKAFTAHGKPDLVTVGIGGNDAGFKDILTHCLFKDCLADPKWGPSQIAGINTFVFDRLVLSFTKIRATFAPTPILAYGYPSVLDPAKSCAGLHVTGGAYDLGPEERTWAEGTLLPTLNQAIADAAATAGITFMPIFDITKGHEICTSKPWINGVRLGSDIGGVGANESFHPNQKAHSAIAQYFLTHYTDGHHHLLFSNPFPDPTIPPPNSPVTEVVGSVDASLTSVCGAGCMRPACTVSSCTLHLNLQNFSPNTSLAVVARSRRLRLGEVRTDAHGRAHAVFRIPNGFPAGVHHLNFSGTSPRGVKQTADSFFVVRRVAVVVAKSRSGYWMLGADGAVYPFGDAVRYSSSKLAAAAAIAPKRNGTGYWIADAGGNVFALGASGYFGGHPALRPGETITAIAPTPNGTGYWLFSTLGRAFAFGNAKFFGDLGDTTLNGPVIASVATPTGRGYYMIGSDGGVFTFGDAKFHGSMGGTHLNRPVVGISPTPDNKGYWLVASDGGVFAFDAPFRGSMGSTPLNQPVDGLVAFGNGYLMVAADGGIFDFSNKAFLGSLGGNPPSASIIAIAAFTAG